MTASILTPEELERLRSAYLAAPEPEIPGFQSPILGLLASADRGQIASLITEERFATGEVIFKEGDMGDAMYIIRSGRVAVVKGDFKSPAVLAYRSVGEIIGEMALLEGQPRSASIVALDPAGLLKIGRENFQQFLGSNAAVGMSILSALSTRLRAADEARKTGLQAKEALSRQVSALQSEKQHLLELNQLRQETSDLIIHDLRNPLSLISGGVNLLEITLPDEILESNREILTLVTTNMERMRRLVDSLLDVAQMESGDYALHLVSLPMSALLEKSVNQIRAVLDSYEIDVAIDIPPNLPAVIVDEEKISRVLANLMDNAVKYTPGGGWVTLTAAAQNGEILVSITNCGPTIPPEDRQRIFERFTRVTSGKPAARGFGLGLAFCRLAVEAHGGKIWVESLEPEEGNRFIFSLPVSANP